jgi:hypothetical protein
MAIIHYPGYITKEQAAARYKVNLDTIRKWMRDKSLRREGFSFIIIDGFVCVKNEHDDTPAPAGIRLSSLALAEKVAIRNGTRDRVIYEQIIAGNITGVVLAGRVFVMPDEPALLSLLKVRRRK